MRCNQPSPKTDSWMMPHVTKSSLRKKTCLRSIRNAFNMAAILGIVPYSLQGHNVVFGTWRLPYNVFCACFFSFLGCYALIFPNPKLFRSFFSIFVFVLQFVAYSLSIIIFLLCNIAYRVNIESVTLQLIKVERMLTLLNADAKISYNYFRGIALPIFLVCCSIGHLIIDRISDFPTIATYLTFHYGNFCFMAIKILILFFMESIRHYLESLVRRASSWEVLLVQLCDIYDKLADATVNLQKAYGLTILFMSLSIFTFVNCNIFLTIKFLNRTAALMFVMWISIASLMMFRICYACERMKEKADEFHFVLYRIIKKDKSCKFLNNACLTASSLKRKSLGINAAGFGEVDLKFFAGMISATVTYTVILIQLGKNF